MTKLTIRTLEEQDFPAIINYWLNCSDEDLIRMGVDKTKSYTAEQLLKRLRALHQTSVNEAKGYYLIWLVDSKAIGYSVLTDIAIGELGCMHLHIWDATYRGKGYGAILYCLAALEYYKLFKFKLMLCEPCATNAMPNKMLTKIGFKLWRTYFGTPAPICFPCDLNSFIIDHETAKAYLNSHIND